MKITITWFQQGKYPSFNIGLHSTPDSEEFLSIKGCKIFDGKDGPFVTYPSTKKTDGNYWRHAYGSKAFNETILKMALKDRPVAPPPPTSGNVGSFDDMSDDIPF